MGVRQNTEQTLVKILEKYETAPAECKNPYEIGKEYGVNPEAIKQFVRTLVPPATSLKLYWTRTPEPFLTVHYTAKLTERVEKWVRGQLRQRGR